MFEYVVSVLKDKMYDFEKSSWLLSQIPEVQKNILELQAAINILKKAGEND